MAVDWEKYKEEARRAADEARANVLAEIQKVEDFYKDQFNKAQSAALEARDADVGLGETPEAFAARIAAVPGAFNDRAQSAAQVVNTPRLEASIATAGVATSATIPGGVAAPSSAVEAPVIIPAPVSDQSEQAPPTPEPQPEQPTPEPQVKAEVTPEPVVQTPVEPPVEPQTQSVEETPPTNAVAPEATAPVV